MKSMTAAAAFAATFFASAPAVAEVPPLSAFAEMPQFDDLEVSPDGKRYAALIARGNSYEVLIINEQFNPERLMTLGDAKVRNLRWAGNDTVLVTFSVTAELPFGFVGDKAELHSVVVIPATEGEPYRVFGGKRDMPDWINGSFGIREVGGKTKGYFGGVRFKLKGGDGYRWDHGRPYLFEVDLESMKTKLEATAAPAGVRRDWLIDTDGDVGVTMEVTDDGTWRLFNARNDKIAGGKEDLARVGLLGFGIDGTSVIYYVREAADEEATWYEVPLAGGEAKEFLPGEDVYSIYTDPANGRVIGYRSYDRNEPPVFFDPARNNLIARIYPAFSGLNTRITDWNADFSKVIVHTSGNGDAGSWYLVDTRTMQPLKLGAEHPKLSAETIGPIRQFNYTAADGMKLDGVLTLPPGKDAKDLPVMIFPHGGPSSHDIVDFDWWAQAFASRGYAVFQPNFRGSTGRGQAFVAAGHGEWGRKMQTDVSDGLAALAKKGIVDPDRACIMGASYGGYAALAGVTLQQGLYKCAISVAGVTDVEALYKEEYYMGGNSRMSRESLTQQLGDPGKLDDVSPVNFADKADAPILLIHGNDDIRVPLDHSRKMASALKSAGKSYEFIELSDEDHWLSNASTRLQMLEEAVAFANKYNPAS